METTEASERGEICTERDESDERNIENKTNEKKENSKSTKKKKKSVCAKNLKYEPSNRTQ